jgi:DNA invertase Pin-like site-specific DNA recombinase
MRYYKHMTTQRRAIGIIRVSQVKGREGESFASPKEQRDRIEQACKRDGLRLVDVQEEMDVSGGAALEKRPGLRAAVEAIEAGRADVVVAAYFDRLFRSIKTQTAVLERIEAAGGGVLAVDVGAISGASAAKWLEASMHGMMAEYFKRQIGEKSSAAQARAVARGVPPLANIPPGYRRGQDGCLVVESREAPVVAEAFRMRASGATLREVCAYMREHDIARTIRSTQTMLASPIMLGEIHFGALVNLEAHPAIVDCDTFRRVQGVKIPRGRRAKSDRLLARLGVLRCGTCGGRMSVGSRNKPIKSTGEEGRYPMYRCSPTGDCPRRVAISAVIAEQTVIEHVREALADVEGRASAEDGARKAEKDLATAQDALDAAVRAFDGLGDVESARERLAELKATVDLARARVDRLGAAGPVISVNAARDWDQLTMDEQRASSARVAEPSASRSPPPKPRKPSVR